MNTPYFPYKEKNVNPAEELIMTSYEYGNLIFERYRSNDQQKKDSVTNIEGVADCV